MGVSQTQALWTQFQPITLAESLMDKALRSSGILRRIIDESGSKSIEKHLETLAIGSSSSYQDRSDLCEVVRGFAAPLLGEATAARVSRDLLSDPIILTANHHGIDYFAQSVQGTLLFYLCKMNRTTTIPVFSCGSVAMNNLTYPQGLLLYGLCPDSLDDAPKKIPLFSDRHKRLMVGAVEPFSRAMVEKGLRSVEDLRRKNRLPARLASCVSTVLSEDYCAPGMFELESYSDQATVVNAKLWKRMFAESSPPGDLAYLELEKITARLLPYDLSNRQSLVWTVMFDGALRERLIDALDGQRICWQRRSLEQRLKVNEDSSRPAAAASGTMFFWAVDETGRRIPLLLTDRGGKEVLAGVDDKGGYHEFQFTEESLMEGLQANRLIPSLFICYTAVALARGMVCLGGYYQAEYLSFIQQVLVRELRSFRGFNAMADSIERVFVDGYLSGMQTVMTEVRKGFLIPAGPMEIISGGGLTQDDLDKIRSLTLLEAHIASLLDTIADVAKTDGIPPDWKMKAAAECHDLLSESIVLK